MPNEYKIPWRYLDPGIRNAVRVFDESGFIPCDSGDGVSKNEHGIVYAFPHVVLACPPMEMVDTCKAAAAMLEEHGCVMAAIDIWGSYPFTECDSEAYVFVGGDALLSLGG